MFAFPAGAHADIPSTGAGTAQTPHHGVDQGKLRRSLPRMVVASMKTADGRYVVYVHERHVAELALVDGARRTTVLGPAALYEITDRLVALGYTDLQPE